MNLPKNAPEGFATYMVYSSKSVTELIQEVKNLQDEVLQLKTILTEVVPRISKFLHYPKWIGKSDALEIVGCSAQKLRQYITDGLIRTRTVSERGDRMYLKEDCILLPENIQLHLKGEFKPLPKIDLDQIG